MKQKIRKAVKTGKKLVAKGQNLKRRAGDVYNMLKKKRKDIAKMAKQRIANLRKMKEAGIQAVGNATTRPLALQDMTTSPQRPVISRPVPLVRTPGI